jgi:hypothetical protein
MAPKRLFRNPIVIGGVILVLILIVLISVRLFKEGFQPRPKNYRRVAASSGPTSTSPILPKATNPVSFQVVSKDGTVAIGNSCNDSKDCAGFFNGINTCTGKICTSVACPNQPGKQFITPIWYRRGKCVYSNETVDKTGKTCFPSVLGCDNVCNSGRVNGCDGTCGSPACPPPKSSSDSQDIAGGLKSVFTKFGNVLVGPKNAGDLCSNDLPCPTDRTYKCARTALSSTTRCLAVIQDGQFLNSYGGTGGSDTQTETCRGNVIYDYLGTSYNECANIKKGRGDKRAYCGSIPSGYYNCPNAPER